MPKVSIIIPVYNQWEYTEMCLNSVKSNTGGIDYVYYEPRSTVVHHEAVTLPKRKRLGGHKTSIINKPKFYGKWKTEIKANHWHLDRDFTHRARWYGKYPEILIVDVKPPEPDIDSGSVHIYNIILLLLKMGFRVTMFPDTIPNIHYAQHLMGIGVEVVRKGISFKEFISPLRYGAGMKGKNNQAMSYGLPLVTTTIGAEGMNIVSGEHAHIADTPEDFAHSVVNLYKSQTLWQKLSVNSKEHFRQNFSTVRVERLLRELFAMLFGSDNIVSYIRKDVIEQSGQAGQRVKIYDMMKASMLHLLAGRKVFIWGAGYFGVRTLAQLDDIGVNIDGFIDMDAEKHGKTAESITIYPPSVLTDISKGKPYVFVGVSTKYRSSVEAELTRLGLFNAAQNHCLNFNHIPVFWRMP